VNLERLTSMANQIGAFFRAQGEAAAVSAIEDHLRRFWDPRMRRQIVEHWRAGGEGLDPLVRAAVARLAAA
jgi:formate dehydrogenase subunit delta